MPDKQVSSKLKAAIWTARVIAGSVFILSGITKAIDIWGFVFKINDYLAVWHIPQPHALVLITASAISIAEFILGMAMATGSYKRTAPWMLMAVMAVMLPLTAYIAIANPVADCGCFGDFLIISNTATLLKNIAITALLAWLLVYNRRISGLYHPLSQWLQTAIAVAYIIATAAFGYHIQPLVDFRPFPEGTNLAKEIAEAQNNDNADNLVFIYEKEGESRQFGTDNLPDSTWTFVDRIEKQPRPASGTPITLFDSDGDEVTSEAVTGHGTQMLLLIPDMAHIDIAATDLVADLCNYVTKPPVNGSFAAILPADAPDASETWTDLAMAEYPVYTADDTEIKQLARGTMSLVLLADGTIQWKRSVSSISPDLMENQDTDILQQLDPQSRLTFILLTSFFILAELLLLALDKSSITIHHFIVRKNKKNT